MPGITEEVWKNRLMDRTDVSMSIVHLTRTVPEDEGGSGDLLDPLFNILDELKIRPSSSAKGFINGKTPATCFQDAPLLGIGQNIIAEQKYRRSNKGAKVRYQAAGLMFSKTYAFKKGVRPVIYEKVSTAKSILPESEYWRIVSYDLSNKDELIDWTHEREWRCPGEFLFDIDEVGLIFPNYLVYRKFVKRCMEEKKNYLEKIRGVCQLGMTL